MKTGSSENPGSAWYDGRFFDIFIAPNQDRIFAHIRKIIGDNFRILDIGCGTGRMEFQLAGRCASIDGVDSSLKNIRVARRKLERESHDNIAFHHADAVEFLSRTGERYDVAVLSFVLHEMDANRRLKLLGSLRSAADRIIMVDYMVPRPRGIRSAFDELVELVAGFGNYRNYRSFVDGGGLAGLAANAGLRFDHELKGANLSAHLAVTSRMP